MNAGMDPNYMHKPTQLSKRAPTSAAICFNHHLTTHRRPCLCNILKLIILHRPFLNNFRKAFQIKSP